MSANLTHKLDAALDVTGFQPDTSFIIGIDSGETQADGHAPSVQQAASENPETTVVGGIDEERDQDRVVVHDAGTDLTKRLLD